MKLDLQHYHEERPHRLKRIIWAGVNKYVFPCLTSELRKTLLRCFGAKIGKALIYRSVRIYAPWNLEIGDWTCIGANVEIYNKDKVAIGSQCVISQDSYICTASHDITSHLMALITRPVKVGDQCWIAAKATVLPGVTIGEGAVVGACAVASKDVPPWTVVVGNPAKEVKRRTLHG